MRGLTTRFWLRFSLLPSGGVGVQSKRPWPRLFASELLDLAPKTKTKRLESEVRGIGSQQGRAPPPDSTTGSYAFWEENLSYERIESGRSREHTV